jgi:hypothetical protein
MTNIIPIDFVAGAHGHFLEITLNKFFGVTDIADSFTSNGTSHQVTDNYLKNRLFCADHWFELYPKRIQTVPKLISIQFTQDDLLLLSSVSLLRAGDFNIDNDILEENTYNKLNTVFYRDTLDLILKSYPFLNVTETNSSIPRNVLREFYKFGFADPSINGYWIKQQQMKYSTNTRVFYFEFKNFYDRNEFTSAIQKLEKFLGMTFNLSEDFYNFHTKFLSFIAYKTHKDQCDQIIQSVVNGKDVEIPKLTLFQESYINGKIENIYKKEMPFHDLNYFTSTKDMLQYITTGAPPII